MDTSLFPKFWTMVPIWCPDGVCSGVIWISFSSATLWLLPVVWITTIWFCFSWLSDSIDSWEVDGQLSFSIDDGELPCCWLILTSWSTAVFDVLISLSELVDVDNSVPEEVGLIWFLLRVWEAGEGQISMSLGHCFTVGKWLAVCLMGAFVWSSLRYCCHLSKGKKISL